jgi:opacity protein-like surface antigen
MYGYVKTVFSIALSLGVLGLAGPAFAQNAPKAEISGGYQYFQAKQKGDSDSEKFKKGWYGDLAGNVNRTVGLVFSVGSNSKTIEDGSDSFDITVHQFLGGVRVSGRNNPMAVPFGQVLVGAMRLKGTQGTFSATENDLGVLAGGGVNLMPKGNVGVRIGLDYTHIKAKSGGDLLDGQAINGFRFVAGIVLGLPVK